MDEATQETALFRALLNACADAVVVSDEEGRILRLNPAATELFGYATGELEGQNVNVLMPRALAERHDQFMSHHLETGETRIIGEGRDVEGLRKDGSVFPMHISIGRADYAGQTYFVAILHDLTRQQNTQRALERSQRLDAIGQMTGGIAHDFNNLLTVIIGNLQLLQMRGGDDKHEELVDGALSAAELGAELIRQLMVFARQSALKPVEADLGVLCKDTLPLLERTLGESNTIKVSIAPDLHNVLVDPVQLRTALVNLALNARDAMENDGHLLISIENVSIDDTYMAQETAVRIGDYVRLSVSDNGIGMSLETQKRAFEPFFTTRFDKGGTGLGLAMVYGFVRQSAGHLSLYSEPGHGTTVSLYLPVLPGDAAGHPSPDAVEISAPPRGNGETVLVVEDNPEVRGFAVARLRDIGYRTEEAKTGEQAYEMLKAGTRADVVFSDLVMPGRFNGFELAARLAEEFPSVKVLLTSGCASDVVSGKAMLDGDYDILHKPYHHADLARRIQAMLTPE
ncbi:PAS domain S-box protein [Aestuariicoccus sp. MJ-SS9]|uniref:PAS domain S-box protein n=1 Tax=Aestuariicoccus sp. MJ-SS9 TaxID=3079855 RepID=UPI00291383D2|nr:PAS domain S-box protein [Aestuariicoccus sp. MJ-SS9]MDU8911608.1 PAS domain S-box protein [Aestuariicoccus sp. MJ-SS9]